MQFKFFNRKQIRVYGFMEQVINTFQKELENTLDKSDKIITIHLRERLQHDRNKDGIVSITV
jgi:nucleoside-triphosphatase THEP1